MDVQQGLFKLTMKSNNAKTIAKVVALTTNKAHPMFGNPLTHLWRVINIFQLLSHFFQEYPKVTKIVMTHILGYVEDQQ
jgi:hypothetical protein